MDNLDRFGLVHALAHVCFFFTQTDTKHVVLSYDPETDHLEERIDETLLDDHGFEENGAFAALVSGFYAHPTDAKAAILAATTKPETVAASKLDAADVLKFMLTDKALFRQLCEKARHLATIFSAMPELTDEYAQEFLAPVVAGEPKLIKREFIERLLGTGELVAA